MPSPFYPSSVVLFQLHGGMVSHMQVLATHFSVSVLFREAFSHPYISFFHLLVNVFSVTCFRTFFVDPLPSFNWWAVLLGGIKIKKWRQLAHHQLLSQQGLILVHTEKLKPKGPFAEKLVYSDISHVVLASVLLGENPSEEVDDYDNYYYYYE